MPLKPSKDKPLNPELKKESGLKTCLSHQLLMAMMAVFFVAVVLVAFSLNIGYQALLSAKASIVGALNVKDVTFIEQADEELISYFSSTVLHVFEKSSQEMMVLAPVTILIAIAVSVFAVRFILRQQKKLIDLNKTLESYNYVLKMITEDTERTNRSKSEFIANMSHELRTPMTAIKGSLGILNSGMIEKIPDEAVDLISMADKNTDRLIELVTDVLDFSKLEANEIDIVEDNFSLHSEIEKFIIPFYKKARSKSIKFNVTLSARVPSTVRLDKIHLFRILAQLINNAIKFTPEGSVKLDIDYHEDDGRMLFQVSDTGIGLNEKDIHFLFESFVQGDGSTTRKFGGTGLGLAICRKLIDALEGDIRVSSKKDEGSTFSLSLPTAEVKEAA